MEAAISTYVLHPLVGRGYQFWSGIGSDIGELALVGAILGLLRRHNCHVKGCWRLQWRPTAAGDLVCRKHHPEDPKTHEQILQAHTRHIRAAADRDARREPVHRGHRQGLGGEIE